MSVYGVSGSGTYAVSFTGLEGMMGVLPDNDVNQIRASDVRNVVLTLWDQGGGGGGSFSYTQTAPFTQVSTGVVGGIGSGRTFSNVPLQTLFDQMFFPAVGTVFSISTAPPSFEIGKPNCLTTVTVNLTKNTPTINTAFVTDDSELNPPYTSVNIPTNFGQGLSTNYPNKSVKQNLKTTFKLTLTDGGSPKVDEAYVTFYYPRFYGSIDLNSEPNFGENFQFTSSTDNTRKQRVLNILSAGSWNPVWNPAGTSIVRFTKVTSAISLATITPINTVKGSHGVFLWPRTDYGGDGVPSSYFLNDGTQPTNPVVSLGQVNFINEYGVPATYSVWIRDFPTKGNVKYVINS